jgi:hypothetical protein
MPGPSRSASAALALAILVMSWLGPAVAMPASTRDADADSGRLRIPIGNRLPVERDLRSSALRAVTQTSTPAGTTTSSAAGNEGGFLGLAANGEIAPSDTTGAGGVTHVVTAVNVSYAVWPNTTLSDPPGTVAPLVTGTLDSLFPTLPGGSFVFDPKVVYDHYAGRFVIAFLAGHGRPFTPGYESSRLLIASIPDATAQDPSTWCLRNLNADQIRRNGKQFGDYPGLGFDREFVYVTTNQFDFGQAERFRYAQIMALGKTQLYDCGAQLEVTAFGASETAEPSGGPAFTIQPAITQSEAGLGQIGYMASFQEATCGFLCGKKLTIWRVKRRGNRLDLASDEVGVTSGRMAPLGTQRDGSPTCNPIEHCWDAGDLRLVTAFYDADRDRLYTAHAVRVDIVPSDGYLESVVRWYEIDPSPIKRSRVTRTGVVGDSGRDSGWPSVATDSAGTIYVNYNRGGAPVPGEYLSAVVAAIPPGSTVPVSSVVVGPGEALYVDETGRPQRWGDFTAANRDPTDPLDVWTVNQYAKTDLVPPTTNLWQQVVNRVTFP